MWFLFIGILNLAFAQCFIIQQYKGYKVFKTSGKDEYETEFLYNLSQSSNQYDFWVLPRKVNETAYILVPPLYDSKLEDTLVRAGLSYNIINWDLSKSTIYKYKFNRRSTEEIDFTRYYRHGEINNYLTTLEAKYPNRVMVKTVSHSFENRPMKTITITNGEICENKKVIFIDAGIHGREWLAPATALYVIHQLTENFKENKHLLKHFDWLILPVANPDGYEYTHTTDRYWRKTRKPNRYCIGTDANRNFDIHWGEIGSSKSGCDETYHGPQPFSEPETVLIRDILLSLTDHAKMYLTLHSFGSYFVYPWGWTYELPETWEDLQEVAEAGANAIWQATGREYKTGRSIELLYPSSGGSEDYAYRDAAIPISITMELPFGGSGFDPSVDEMQFSIKESWVGIKAMAEKVAQKYS